MISRVPCFGPPGQSRSSRPAPLRSRFIRSRFPNHQPPTRKCSISHRILPRSSVGGGPPKAEQRGSSHLSPDPTGLRSLATGQAKRHSGALAPNMPDHFARAMLYDWEMAVATESTRCQILRERSVIMIAFILVFRPKTLLKDHHNVLAPLHAHSNKGACL